MEQCNEYIFSVIMKETFIQKKLEIFVGIMVDLRFKNKNVYRMDFNHGLMMEIDDGKI